MPIFINEISIPVVLLQKYIPEESIDYLLRIRLMAEEAGVDSCLVAETGREVQSKLGAASCKVYLVAGSTDGMGLEEIDMKAVCEHYRSMVGAECSNYLFELVLEAY
ncbi:hypothetical protein PsorP6_017488 [Peronosclerospora sorghi]|uniref:Uncharacterized protein n=1 Tax=Peronosclerospora sorghi TaxID=230839 RepID=A0ACC0WN27_9STRA|nr:hypothetical protein PsorP6_017488 [Peronosclerospora sorghi]